MGTTPLEWWDHYLARETPNRPTPNRSEYRGFIVSFSVGQMGFGGAVTSYGVVGEGRDRPLAYGLRVCDADKACPGCLPQGSPGCSGRSYQLSRC